MIINPLLCDITHTRRLLAAVTECGGTPPETLAQVLEGLDALTSAARPQDPTAALIQAAFDGGAAGAEKALGDYALAKVIADERKNLRGKLDGNFLREFCDRLEAGGADAILDALRPKFDQAAHVISEAQAIVDVSATAADIIDTAGPDELAAWQSIPAAVATLDQLASVAIQFGSKAQSFPLIDKPHNVEWGWAEDRAIMCSTGDLINDSRAFGQWGSDPRKSAWLRVNPNLNTIDQARERVRAYAENAWASINAGQANRGRLTESGDVAWDSVHNPFALAIERG